MTGEQGTRYIIVGAVLALVLILTGLGLGYLVADPIRQPEVIILPTRVPPPTANVPTLTPTLEGQPTLAPATPDAPLLTTAVASAEAVIIGDTATPMPTLLPDEIVRFRAQVDGILAHAGPSDEVGVVGALSINEEVLVAGRTGDGVWWLVCCVGTAPAWVKLENANMLLISGDIATVDVVQ